MTIDPIFQIGKSSVTPELTAAVAEALEARELIKLSILKNCLDDGKSVAAVLAERTHSEVVQVIGRKSFSISQLRMKKRERSFFRKAELSGKGGLTESEEDRYYGRNL